MTRGESGFGWERTRDRTNEWGKREAEVEAGIGAQNKKPLKTPQAQGPRLPLELPVPCHHDSWLVHPAPRKTCDDRQEWGAPLSAWAGIPVLGEAET